MSGAGDITQFFGRFHPVLVHLPIGLIVLLVFLELLARTKRFRNAANNAGLILAIAGPASVVTALLGWLLSLAGGYDSQLLSWHFWAGIATAGFCLLAGFLLWRGCRRAYLIVLGASFVTLVVASHFGGSLTHGRDYLFEYAPGPLKALLGGKPSATPANKGDWASQPVYTLAVQPVLNQYCVGCHGPEKSKGGLRLDTHERLMHGGESGPVLVPGNSVESLLVKLLSLPLTHEDHMPPEGKPQPSSEDVRLIKAWIDGGASAEQLAGDEKNGPELKKQLEDRFGSTENTAAPASRTLVQVLPDAERLSAHLGIVIGPVSATNNWLHVNASIAGKGFGDAQLEQLLPLNENVRHLDLSGTSVTDDGMRHVAMFTRLSKLQMSRTSVGDAGLARLGSLSELEYLNLYGTAITDAGLGTLKALPKLTRLYLWQTAVSTNAAGEWAKAKIDEAQIAHLKEEIQRLQQQLSAQRVIVDLGTQNLSTNQPPVLNAACPVSGKPASPGITLVHKGTTVAFCCEDCRSRFKAQPETYFAKLTPESSSTNVVSKSQ